MNKAVLTDALRTMHPRTAGGAGTNLSGKTFEQIADHRARLFERGFRPAWVANGTADVLEATLPECRHVVFARQKGLRRFLQAEDRICLYREPDEAYVVSAESGRELFVVEMKAQRGNGSVETKLWSGPSLKREYELVLGDAIDKVHYAFCLNTFLYDSVMSHAPKYRNLHTILAEHDIRVFHGESPDYFNTLSQWVGIP